MLTQFLVIACVRVRMALVVSYLGRRYFFFFLLVSCLLDHWVVSHLDGWLYNYLISHLQLAGHFFFRLVATVVGCLVGWVGYLGVFF